MKKRVKQFILLVLSLSLLTTIATQRFYLSEIDAETEKTQEGLSLGVSALRNPIKGNGGWTKVYFGSVNDPLSFNVLNIHETSFGGETLLLDCDSVVTTKKATDSLGYQWNNSNLRTSAIWDVDIRRFTESEQDAVFVSRKDGAATDKGDVFPIYESSDTIQFEYAGLFDDRVFILDASEMMNENYGFSNNKNATNLRKKSGGEYWVRSGSGRYTNYVGYVKSDGSMTTKDGYRETSGISPAFNIALNRILFTTHISGTVGEPGATYKLTILDNKNHQVLGAPFVTRSNGTVTRSGNEITASFSVSGRRAKNATQISVLVTDKQWNEENTTILKYGKLNLKSGNVTSSGTGTFELPDNCEAASGSDYHVYIFAEDVNGGNLTDFASTPVEINVPKAELNVEASPYEGVYDGQAHSIELDVFPSSSTIKYGEVEGTYDLNELTLTDVGEKTVYYEVSDGSKTITGSSTITITPRPIKISGVTASDKVYDGTTNASIDTTNMNKEGIVDGDDVSVSVIGSFIDANAGDNKQVNIILNLSGDKANNYVLDNSSQTTTNASISKKSVKVSGIKAYNKIHDGTTKADLYYSEVIIDGKIPIDDLSVTAVGEFVNANYIGYNQPVSISNISLTGSDIDNYVLASEGQQTETSAMITAKGNYAPLVTVSNQTHVYDGNPHTITVNVESMADNPDDSRISTIYSETESFTPEIYFPPEQTTVGTRNINIRVSDQNTNPIVIKNYGPYTLSVTPRQLTVNISDAIEKVYDGNTSVSSFDITNASLNNVVDSDDVRLTSGTAVFADVNVGDNKTITISNISIGGSSANNYMLSSSTQVTGRITKRPITISGITAQDKTYDGNNDATLDTSGLTINNLVDGDDVNVNVIGTFESADAGDDKKVFLNYVLTGDDAGNYELDLENSQKETTANINKKELTVTKTNVDTVYDGNEHSATVSVNESIAYEIKYGEEEGTYDLTENPKYKDVCNKQVYYQIVPQDNNYHIQLGVLLVSISPKTLTVSGVEAEDKSYDGNTEAVLNLDNMRVEGIVPNDDVSVNVSGEYEDANEGHNKKINLSYELEGEKATNYVINIDDSQKETNSNIIGPSSYKNTKGDGNTWYKGSNVTSDFTFKNTVDDEITYPNFVGIKVDGKDVASSNYTSAPGSVVVKLKPAFLETLSLGEHTITALFKDNMSASATFKVLQRKSDNRQPVVPNTSAE